MVLDTAVCYEPRLGKTKHRAGSHGQHIDRDKVKLCSITMADSLATSPSPPGQLHVHTAKPRAEGGEGLANIALDHVSLECQLHVSVLRRMPA